ncbi:hypothetical protein [Rhizobium leguminosarum]|uniref:hypothetical protein n=1 Tax=Rhizobium leguminosarum TaxID=384 RepID=UPI00103ABEDB|nr:hypothetical protein [Rhizobium leguminosarum]TBY41601.1 hypothetical protein E0H54_30900 [Rhizobium leguminosarum bv. viciae]
MPDVIDFQAERDRRNGPDEQFRTVDQAGRPMFAFLAEYETDAGIFCVNFFAYDFADAELRVSSMRSSLTLAGQIYAEIPG